MTALSHIAAYLLGVISFGAFMLWLLVKLHPKATPPTLRRRRWRDDPIRGCPPGTQFHEIPATVKWEAKATDDERGVNYSFMGATGLEE